MTDTKFMTSEEFERFMSEDLVVAAIKSLYRKGDIIEVRAWDKEHNVYTGRYNYGSELAQAVKLFDAGGCDVYMVLNPVGDKLGLRVMSSGGLCTWEKDVPWRRRFLLDFDPRREYKIATDDQFKSVWDAASAAKAWLESYGWMGIVLALSGNGCHLLVPCDLPNDAPSKELVRKIQRVVSEKFSTAEAECECFPDANRLVRAYGSTNKKGTETSVLKHRMSGVVAPDEGTCNPKEIIARILAEHPIADAIITRRTGEGEGPFTRDSLFERLQCWKEGFEGENGERFEFEETTRRDGFRVLCPGNLDGGWQDGEEHGDHYDSLNDSSIVWVENGWPKLSCRHSHCGEGAEHGKKSWLDLQTFYDPERKLHRIVDETDYSAKWNLEYLDDGVVAEEATAQEVEEATTVEPAPRVGSGQAIAVDAPEDSGVEDVEFVKSPAKSTGAEVQAEACPDTEAGLPLEDKAKRKGLHELPDSCMYGWLGTKAHELQTPLGFAYPAMLTAFAGLINSYPNQVRPTLYTCLIGPVHCGKSETIKRALASLDFPDPETVKWTVPGSDRGLINIFGGKKKKDDKENGALPQFPKTRLLAQDELRNTIAKANIQGSSLPATLCSLWSQDEAGAADKTGEHVALVRLNLLGALKAEDAEDFAEAFGSNTTGGLYDRFIFGIAAKGWKYNQWTPNKEIRCPTTPTITPACFEMLADWRDEDSEVRGRLGEIALRVAYISAAANHDKEVSVECMKAALEFMAWQEAIRAGYKAGLGDTLDAQATNAILSILEKLDGKWIRWRDLAIKKNWYRKFGAPVLGRVRDSLSKTGITLEETADDGDGKQKRTGRIRLRQDEDDK